MVNNKFVGIYKTESEYDYRECLVVCYGIPKNREMTDYDFDNSLIVDLRTVSHSVSEYLRDVSLSTEAQSCKTFMEFATKRKFQSRDVDILTYLYSNDHIKKVPSECIKILFKDATRGEYGLTVAEINDMIKVELNKNKQPLEGEEWKSVIDEIPRELEEVKEVLPLIERSHSYDEVVPTVESTPDAIFTLADEQPSSEKTDPSLFELLQEMRTELSRVSTELAELRKQKPKVGRPKKETPSE